MNNLITKEFSKKNAKVSITIDLDNKCITLKNNSSKDYMFKNYPSEKINFIRDILKLTDDALEYASKEFIDYEMAIEYGIVNY